MHSASSSLNKRFLSRFHSLWFIHCSTLSLTVSLTALYILGLLHRIILFGKIFTCHVITILPFCIIELLPSIKVFISTALLIALFTSVTSLRCFLLFLGRLRLCVLFIESTSLLTRLILSSLCLLSPICHRLVTCHRLVMLIFRFSLPPSLFVILGLVSYVGFSFFLKSSKAAPLVFIFFCGLAGARPAKGGDRGSGPFSSAGQK